MDEIEILKFTTLVAKNDDMDAYEKLYYYYYRKLCLLAKFYVKNDEVSEEIVNDTFIAVWKNRRGLFQVKNFTFYIYRALKNRCLNYIHDHKNMEFVAVESLQAELVDHTPNKFEELVYQDLNTQINAAIAKLPEQCKVVFKMVKQDGLKHKEVAEILDVSVRTVEYHMSVAIKKIAQSVNSLNTSAVNR